MSDSTMFAPANSNTTVKKFYSIKSSQNASSTLGDSNWLTEEPNVNQLDTLLQDLKTERVISREKDLFDTSRNSHKTIEYDTIVRDTKQSYPGTKSYFTKKEEYVVDSSKAEPLFKTINLRDETFTDSHSTYPTSKSYYTKQENIVRDTLKSEPGYKTISVRDEVIERKIGGGELDKSVSSQIYDHQTSSYSSSNKKAATIEPYYLKDDLQKLPLTDDILPVPGTKVTTTVRTYTYEVPGEPVVNTSKKVYVKDVSTTLKDDVLYSDHNIRPTSPLLDQYAYEERNSSTIGSNRTLPSTKTITYTTKSHNIIDQSVPLLPDDETISSHRIVKRHNLVPIDQVDSSKTYYYSNESNTSTHTSGVPRDHRSPPRQITYTVDSTTDLHHPQPQHPNGHGPSVVSYKFTSTSTNRIDSRDSPQNLQPFPVYETDGPNDTKPPKHLNDLLSTLDNGTGNGDIPVDRYNPKSEVETAVARDYRLDSSQQKTPSKNLAGPPVYYPPNHELTLRKEESSAAWRAQGGYAKASGKYEYEAESKSKSKSSSGAAVVPVCLPLCCAMPCSIM